MAFNVAIAVDEICSYVLLWKSAHDLLPSEEDKEQNTQLQNSLEKVNICTCMKNVGRDINILYTVLVKPSGRTALTSTFYFLQF